jgi:hypothetical protein
MKPPMRADHTSSFGSLPFVTFVSFVVESSDTEFRSMGR